MLFAWSSGGDGAAVNVAGLGDSVSAVRFGGCQRCFLDQHSVIEDERNRVEQRNTTESAFGFAP